jgi:hypothetical protein
VGYRLRVNRFVRVVDGAGTVMDRRRADWLAEGRELPLGCRLDCEYGRAERLSNPERPGWNRVVCAALKPPDPECPWLVVLEGPGVRMTVPLGPEIHDVLGTEEAVELLERELLVEQDRHGHHCLHAIPSDDPELPGGVPAWHETVTTTFAWTGAPSDPCPCLSLRPWASCHGS